VISSSADGDGAAIDGDAVADDVVASGVAVNGAVVGAVVDSAVVADAVVAFAALDIKVVDDTVGKDALGNCPAAMMSRVAMAGFAILSMTLCMQLEPTSSASRLGWKVSKDNFYTSACLIPGSAKTDCHTNMSVKLTDRLLLPQVHVWKDLNASPTWLALPQ
jgi:hypothetical protein